MKKKEGLKVHVVKRGKKRKKLKVIPKKKISLFCHIVKKFVPFFKKTIIQKKKDYSFIARVPSPRKNQKEQNKTQIDFFYEYILQNKSVTLTQLMKRFNLSKEIVQQWGEILASHKMIIVHYPAFGEPRFKKRQEGIKTEEDEEYD